MSDEAKNTPFDPEAAGRIHAQELLNQLLMEYHTAETFTAARAQVRQALLEALDAIDPTQAVENARFNAQPEEMQRRFADESEQRKKERGSLNDPLYPPKHGKSWD